MAQIKSSDDLFSIDLDDRPIVLVDQVSEVCAVSQSARDVMDLTRDNTSPVQPIADAVARDPALAAEVLRIANSPVFGQARKIQDLHRAVVVIGLQELHNMAAAMAMLAAFPTEEAELSAQLHGSCVLSATMSRFLSRELGGVNPSTAFLCGLLCEIGAMACIYVDNEEYASIWASSHGSPDQRARLEKERYGATSEQIGARMLERNKLPEDVVAAIEASVITPQDEMDSLAKITVFSRVAAPLLIHAANEEDPSILSNDIPALAERLCLGDIGNDKLIQICIEAGTTAELSLRGEVALVEEETVEEQPAEEETVEEQPAEQRSSGVAPSTQVDPPLVVQQIRLGETSFLADKKWLVLGLTGIGLVAAIAAIVFFVL